MKAKSDPDALLDALTAALRDILRCGLEELSPAVVHGMTELISRHGARLRYQIEADGPRVTCELVPPAGATPREPITVFVLARPTVCPPTSVN
jgi:hypothetical protein